MGEDSRDGLSEFREKLFIFVDICALVKRRACCKVYKEEIVAFADSFCEMCYLV